jgi:hypothetical protein
VNQSQNLELVFVFKRIQENDVNQIFNVFSLNSIDLIGKNVYQYRNEEFLNTFQVTNFEKSKVWVQKQENLNLEFGDIFYIDKPIPVFVEKDPRSQVFIFPGKNWRLATFKKWKSDYRDCTNFEFICDFVLNNLPCEIYRDRETFVAKPKTV